jgi:hypothetical protein
MSKEQHSLFNAYSADWMATDLVQSGIADDEDRGMFVPLLAVCSLCDGPVDGVLLCGESVGVLFCASTAMRVNIQVGSPDIHTH